VFLIFLTVKRFWTFRILALYKYFIIIIIIIIIINLYYNVEAQQKVMSLC